MNAARADTMTIDADGNRVNGYGFEWSTTIEGMIQAEDLDGINAWLNRIAAILDHAASHLAKAANNPTARSTHLDRFGKLIKAQADARETLAIWAESDEPTAWQTMMARGL